MSTLDGLGKIHEYADKAKRIGQSSLAFTDHGTMRGYYTHHMECSERGVKPIYGCEFYVSKNMRRKGLTDEEKADLTRGVPKNEQRAKIVEYEEREGIRDRWHITVWALDDIGLKNLYKLTSASYIEGFYYKPRIDIDELIKYNEGLAVGTGCLSSPINDRVLNGQRREAMREADRLFEAFGERCFIELQPHDLDMQRDTNRFALRLRERWGQDARFIATQDAHYVDQGDAPHHEVLLCIGTGKSLKDPDRFKFDGDEFYMKTRKEMRATFLRNHDFLGKKVIREALDTTVDLASMITAKVVIDHHKALVPDVPIPTEYGEERYRYLKDLCVAGWQWREINERARAHAKREKMEHADVLTMYRERLKKELGSIKKLKFVGYFLIVRDLYDWVRKQEMMCGPGRGSAAGSLVSFLLGITAVDPIEHGLIFERFINPSRHDLPDIDMDFEDVRRQEIIEYLRQRYGSDKVCQIATISKLSGKQCIKDVSRVLDVPYAAVNEVTASILERSSGDERASMTIEDSFKEFDVCKKFNEKYPEVLHHAKRLEGMSKNLGIHAAGVVTSPVPLTDVIPLEIRKSQGADIIVSAIDMYGVGAMGLLKLDVLGLRTLTVLNDCIKEVKRRHDVDIDLERLDLNDPETLAGFTAHEYVGIFQYDSPGADKICTGVEFVHFEDIAAMTALNRPGTARSGLATQYVERKKNPKLVAKSSYHPAVSEITKDTLGIIVYQEHVLRIFTDIAGFMPSTADSLRKKIAKKFGDETIGKERENFIEGAVKTTPGMTKDIAGKLMDAITFFGSYGFNKCVSAETIVVRAGGANPEITIEDLYDAQESNTAWGKKIRSGRLHLLQMDDDGRIRPGRLEAIHRNGKLQTYVLKTSTGRTIRATGNHRFMTSRGYQTVDSLRVGVDQLVCMGEAEKYVLKGRQTARARGKTFDGLAGGIGTPTGAVNPAWIDGRDAALKAAKQAVKERAAGCCEQCRAEASDKAHALEAAHTRSLEECGGDYLVYNAPANLRMLCNSCHKRFDYEKGERKPRWSKGRPTVLETIESISPGKVEWVYDVEMATPEHNFIANGIVSHNSHATAYGVIAYWGMWLKMHYPLEFYWALLKNEPQRIDIQQIAKDAKRHAIALLPPSVNTSGEHFRIDDKAVAIRGSLVDIKGCGEKAAKTIMEAQPFADFGDFLDRKGSACHKGVVMALAKAGALDELLPNVRWFVEHAEELWPLFSKSKSGRTAAMEQLAASASEPQWDVEEAQLIASQVNPLAFGKHPIDAYKDFLERHVRVPIISMSEEGFWKEHDGKTILIAGVIVEVKLNQIGDFHTGDLPSESERKRMFWGRRYANVNVEDAGGKQNRIKFDFDIYDDTRHIIELGIGAPVLVMATANGKFENLRAHFAVDLEGMRRRLKKGEEGPVWEAILDGRHPIKSVPAKDEDVAKRRRTNAAFWKSPTGGMFHGTVTNVRPRYDKKGGLMANFGMIDAKGRMMDCVCFASVWDDSIAAVVTAGSTLSIQLERQSRRKTESTSAIFNGGTIKRHKRKAP